MHYQHRFHAGNFADVVKHVALCALIEAMNRKPAAWCYIDTHAGAGRYDLAGAAATRTGEWQEGIGGLMTHTPPPGPLADYLQQVRGLGAADWHRHYPGSPALAQALARPQDRLYLYESVAAVAAELKERMAGDARVSVQQRDGFEAAAMLPPAERRGLLLIDPPFEQPDEFEAIGRFLGAARKRFAHGIYTVWYPLKKRFDADRFLRRVAREQACEWLDLRFETGAAGAGQMRGCGVLVLNPPYQLDASLRAAMDWLSPRLAQGPTAGWTLRMQLD